MTRSIAAVVACFALFGACGDSGNGSTTPARVPEDLVPARMLDDTLGVIEDTSDTTREVLASASDDVLVSDTRIWEVRRGQRLVGTIQISTVLPEVDLLDEDVRDRFVAQVILGQASRIRVGDVEVFTTTANDKTTYLWFASDLFEVMQTKDRDLDPEALLTDLVDFQRDKPGWNPLPELIEDA